MLNREPESYVAPPRRRGMSFILIIVAIIVLLARTAAVIWTDYLWYDSVGLVSVWGTRFWTQVALVVVASLIAFGFLFLNLVVADRLSPRFRVVDLAEEEEVVEKFTEWVEPRIRRVRTVLAAVFGVMLGLNTAAWLDDVLAFLNSTPFGQTDPQYGLDISFYVFRLPVWRDLADWGFQLVLAATILVAALHYLNGGIRVRQGRPPEVGPKVKAHLSVMFAVLAVLKAAAYQLDSYELLIEQGGKVFGAGYTDVNARIPALRLLVLISLAAAALLIYNIRRQGWTLPAVALGSWLAVSIVVGGIIPAAVQRFQVEPQELERELPFVERQVELTRQAYDLDTIEVRAFPAEQNLDAEALAANRSTVENIRLWDPTVLVSTYRQLQELRTFYKFEDVDIDRYMIDGQLTQVMLSARELDQRNLPAGAEGWVNDHLVYTHGFGAVLSPANAVTRDGQPEFFVKDIPPATDVAGLEVTSPRIYFGEAQESDSFVIAGTNEQEVDFPDDSDNGTIQLNSYDGDGGVVVGGLFRKSAFALRFGDFNTLIAQQVSSDSKVLMVRNVADRVRKAAPFLHADADPYLMLIEGRFLWMIDMYTVTGQYPYSEPTSGARLDATRATLPVGLNYLRNSVKAVVDAFDGSMTLYVVDPTDPLVQTYQKIYPDLFTDGEEMPDAVRQHLRYPEDLFRIQSDVYAVYHVQDPRVFFNVSDQWSIARDPASTTVGTGIRFPQAYAGSDNKQFSPMLPYYLLMKLPGDSEEAFLIMQPFTPTNKPNMASFLVANSDPDNYGRLVDFQLPRDELVDGPGQIGARINQDPDISREFTLLGQEGSVIIQGQMLVVPIEESVMYVQPIYLRGEENPLPEFKRVVVVYDDQIVMEESLDLALARIFEGYQPSGGEIIVPDDTPDGETLPEDVAELLDRATAAFGDAQEALAAGDLGEYQSKVDEAQRLVQQAIAILEVSP